MSWFGGSYKQLEFHMFSVSHLSVLAMLLIVVAATFLFRYKFHPALEKKLEIGLAVYLLTIEAFYHLWMIRNESWHMSHSIPVELCSIGLFLAAALLISQKRIIYEILLFTGLLGASQALLTPFLYFDFPHFRFFHFFSTHMIIFWTPIYFTLVKGWRPTIYSVWKTMLFLNILLPAILLLNKMVGGNYMYLSHKPATASMLDYFGPYPYYIISLEIAAFVLSMGIYLVFRARKRSTVVERGRGLDI